MILEKKYFLAICMLCMTHVTVSQSPSESCEGQPDETIFPSLEYCEQYYVCVGGAAHQGTCPDGRWYNPESLTCDLPESFICTAANSPNNPGPGPGPPVTECPERGIDEMKHPYSCSKYIICVNGFQFDQDCPEGQHYNPTSRNCIPEIDSECTINSEWCHPTDNIPPFFVASSRDCTSYYLCMRNEWLGLTCAPGFFFDANNRWCQVPDEVDCSPSIDHDLSLPSDGVLEFDCPNERGAFFHRHPESCSHYFICMNGESTLRFCGHGLEYDASRESCNYAHLANCARPGIIPA